MVVKVQQVLCVLAHKYWILWFREVFAVLLGLPLPFHVMVQLLVFTFSLLASCVKGLGLKFDHT